MRLATDFSVIVWRVRGRDDAGYSNQQQRRTITGHLREDRPNSSSLSDE
jgi:hypothetical protein